MGTLSQTKTGMAGLAITHSLPIASLIWSYVVSIHLRIRPRVAHVVSRIALFSVALAVQIFGRRESATVATLSVEVLVIFLFVFMGMRVFRPFSQNDDGQDGDASVDMNSHV